MADKKTYWKNLFKFCLILAVSLALSYCLIAFQPLDMEKIKESLIDYQGNLISTSATIGGFLFTGISIMISSVGNGQVERLWKNNYLDNSYRAAAAGIVANIVTIVAAFLSTSFAISESVQRFLIHLEIMSVIISLVFFVWCVYEMIYIISIMKKQM